MLVAVIGVIGGFAQIISLTGWFKLSVISELVSPALSCNWSIRYSWEFWANCLRSVVSKKI